MNTKVVSIFRSFLLISALLSGVYLTAQTEQCESELKNMNRKDKIPMAKFNEYENCVRKLEISLNGLSKTYNNYAKLLKKLKVKEGELKDTKTILEKLEAVEPDKEDPKAEKKKENSLEKLNKETTELEGEIEELKAEKETILTDLKAQQEILKILEKSFDKLYTFYDEQDEVDRAEIYEKKKEKLQKYKGS